jgi:hypothetical protein
MLKAVQVSVNLIGPLFVVRVDLGPVEPLFVLKVVDLVPVLSQSANDPGLIVVPP